MNYKSKLTLIIIGVLIVFTLTGLNCSLFKKSSESTPSPTATTPTSTLAETNLTNVDPITISSIVDSNYNLAKTKAQSWKADATLATVQVKLPTDLVVNQSNETYIFGSATDTVNWWTFSVSEQSGKYIRAIIPREDYLGSSIKPIDPKYWKLNYIQAFQAADKSGGADFRNNNAGAQITATLHRTQPKEWLWWEIEYKVSDTNKLILKVNASDGNVVDEQGNPVSSGTSTSTSTSAATPTTTATTTAR